MKLSALWLATAFALGVWLGQSQHFSPIFCATLSFCALALGFAVLLSGWSLMYPASWFLAALAWTSLGMLAAVMERAAILPNSVAAQVSKGALDISGPLRWRGTLREDPLQLPWGLRYHIALEGVEYGGKDVPISGGLRLNYYFPAQTAILRQAGAESGDGQSNDMQGDSALPALRAGDRLEVLARAHLPRNFRDPGAFDEVAYLERQNIALTATLRDAALLRRLSSPPPSLSQRLARARGALTAKLQALFPGDLLSAAASRAMLLGDRSFVDSDLATTFQKTAAYHVLVVAGLHMVALVTFLIWLARRFHLPRIASTLLCLLALWAFVSIVQDRPPILRAALMATIFLASRLLFRRCDLLNTAGLAALLLLLAKPSFLSDPSFLLSFLAAGAIAGLALPWINRTSSEYRRALEHLGDATRDGSYAPRAAQFRLDMRAAAGWLRARLPRFLQARAPALLTTPMAGTLRLWELLLLSVTIQMVMLPALAHYFHRISLAGPIANIPAVILTSLIVPLGFLALTVGVVWTRAGLIIAIALKLLVHALIFSVQWFSRWPHSSYRIPGPSLWLGLAFLVVLALLAALAHPAESRRQLRSAPSPAVTGRRKVELASFLAVAGLGALIATHPFAPNLRRGELEVTVLDVGQGDSLFVAFPDGHTMLVDGGGENAEERIAGYHTGIDVGEAVVSPYLWSRGLTKLDVVLLTHAHHDHLDGLHAVLENFAVGELWVGRDVASPAYRQLLGEAQQRGTKVVHRHTGEALVWNGASGRILWPPQLPASGQAANDDSLVLEIQDGLESLLLPGDVEHRVEESLLSQGWLLRADFLKVPHHGSKTSSTSEFLHAVAPKVAVISVGADNTFGHPHPSVIERYGQLGIRLLRTDRDGAITALTDGHFLKLRTFAEDESAHPSPLSAWLAANPH